MGMADSGNNNESFYKKVVTESKINKLALTINCI